MSARIPPAPSLKWSVLAGLVLVLITACSEPVTSPDRGEPGAPPIALSHGDYDDSHLIFRIPYADGSMVTVTRDHHDHTPVNRIDMAGDAAGYEIVAAASGTIRAIVDRHGNSGGNGDGLSADGSQPNDDEAEHGCQDDGTVVGSCSDYNNYVWIEHPGGEWTKYSHFATASVQGNGWSVGDWVEAGQVLGVEGDVGAASGRHLHFEVGVPSDPDDLTPFSQLGGFMVPAFGENVVPRTCGLADLEYVTGEVYAAAPCDHLPPTAHAGGPYEVDEGFQVPLDGSGSSDPEGLPLTYAWEPAENMDDPSLERPRFRGVDDGDVPVTLTVYDQVEALDASAQTTVTVLNVAPDVWIAAGQPTEITEGGTLPVTAEFGDPGILDAPFSATVLCHDVDGYEAEVEGTVNVAPGDGPLMGTVTADCPLGDTSRSGDLPEGTFTVTVTVTDKDGGEGSASFQVTVLNEAPEPVIEMDGATLVNGVPTLILSTGEKADFQGTVTDPGSDDLLLDWDFMDGNMASATYLLDAPTPDPFPSPDVDPRNVLDARSHVFQEACLYTVTLVATDDDGDTGMGSAAVVVTGSAGDPRGPGYWMTHFRGNQRNGLDEITLNCYLGIVGHMSAVFNEDRDGTSGFTAATDVLWTNDSRGQMYHLLDRHLFTAWLNFANGAFGWDEMVDTDGDGVGDVTFGNAVTAVEAVRLDPDATRQELEEQKDLLERLSAADGN